MNIDEQLALLRDSIDAVVRIQQNGGRVPFDEILEFRDRDGKWNVCDRLGSAPDFAPLRLRDETPRFTVSKNPLGMLDSRRPGKICLAGPSATVGDVERLLLATDDHLSSDIYDWSDLEVQLGPEDIPPLSVIRVKHGPSWGWVYAKPTEKGVMVIPSDRHLSLAYEEMFLQWEIKRPGDDWKPCRKAAK